MSIKLGVVMDPIGDITVKKDTTLAMLLAAQARGWELNYMELGDLRLRDGKPGARMRTLSVTDDATDWYRFEGERAAPLSGLDVILMRKDPPFDMEFVYSTYLLEHAEREGVLIVNKPQSLRDANEKLFTAWFPQCCPPTLVARDAGQFREFLAEHGEVIFKPLDGMGGASIFRAAATDPNISVIIETLTAHGTQYAMAQRYLPAIADGDKRVLMIDGAPIGYALARIPSAGETRGNLAAGGSGEGRELSDRDRWICEQVGPELARRGLLFVGLDVIGDHLTEINVTSPTCVRELDRIFDIDIGGMLMDAIEQKLEQKLG
jgi:glutathione synthase